MITQLHAILGKILLLHAGGYSKRLPNVSVIGKPFTTLPIGKEACLILPLLIFFLPSLECSEKVKEAGLTHSDLR